MNLDKFKNDKYLFILEDHKMISIFDHINYDRADTDILSKEQRDYLLKKLEMDGYYHKSGRILASEEHSTKFIYPKQSILSGDIGDFTLNQKRESDDYFVLTPTQLAIYIIKEVETDVLDILKSLISKHPVNLKRIYDLSHNDSSKEFITKNFRELERFQEDIINTTSVGSMSHLGKVL